MPTGERFAGFAAALTRETIPDAALTRACWTLRDTVGAALGGAATSAARIARESAARDAGGFAALAPGAPASSATGAAFASSVAASALDYDDGHHLGGAIHPASVIVPTLLVAASDREVSLADLLVAQVAAYEVGLRAAHLLWPRRDDDRYHCTGTAATIGAAAGAAKLRGGDADTLWRAMRIAWAHAPMAGLQFPMVKEAIGWSTATALQAALLAEDGFMAYGALPGRPEAPAAFPPTPFDAVGAAQDPFVASLGERWETERTYFKPFSCCRFTHAAADGLRTMIEDGLDPGEIRALRVRTHRWAQYLAERRPPTLEHAQYSFPFVLGSIAVHGDARPAQICEARLTDPDVLAFAERVSVVHDPELDAHYPAHYAAAVEVETSDGRRLEQVVVEAPGDPERPLAPTQMAEKFDELASGAIGPGPAAELSALLDDDGVATATSGDLWPLLRGAPAVG